MLTESKGLGALLRPPPLRSFKLMLLVYAASAFAMSAVAFALYPIFDDPRPWRQKLIYYAPPILLGFAVGSPLLRTGMRILLRLVREPSGVLHPTHK